MLQDPKVKDPGRGTSSDLARRGQGATRSRWTAASSRRRDAARARPRVARGGGHRPVRARRGAGSSPSSRPPRRGDARLELAQEPAWVNLRFGRNVEVKDVPALMGDLRADRPPARRAHQSAPGRQFFRHVNATFDRRGDQFVVRKEESVGAARREPRSALLPSGRRDDGSRDRHAAGRSAAPVPRRHSRPFPSCSRTAAWKKAGVDVRTLTPVADMPNVKDGTLPDFRFGGLRFAEDPGGRRGADRRLPRESTSTSAASSVPVCSLSSG